jgi:hypothetical protein
MISVQPGDDGQERFDHSSPRRSVLVGGGLIALIGALSAVFAVLVLSRPEYRSDGAEPTSRISPACGTALNPGPAYAIVRGRHGPMFLSAADYQAVVDCDALRHRDEHIAADAGTTAAEAVVALAVLLRRARRRGSRPAG